MFFVVALIILWVIHGYVAWRVVPTFGLPSGYSILAYSFIFILSILPIVPILLRVSGSEAKIIDRLSLLGYTSLGFFTLSFLIFLAKDIFIQAISIFDGLINGAQAVDESKRDFLKGSLSIGLLGITGTASTYGYYSARNGPKVFHQDIFLEFLPDEFENFTIAQISDLHVGSTIKRPYVEKILSMIGHLNPDLIAVTGDLVDGSVAYLREDVEPLKNMIANYGTYFVTGNHEY